MGTNKKRKQKVTDASQENHQREKVDKAPKTKAGNEGNHAEQDESLQEMAKTKPINPKTQAKSKSQPKSKEQTKQQEPKPSGRSFRTLNPPLSSELLDFLEHTKSFHTMTPVQEATIPLFLKHHDVAVQAVTGSGKTLAFLLPVVERLRQRKRGPSPYAKNQIGALILSPTRELAMQTWRVCQELCQVVDLAPPLLLVGGGSASGGSSGNNHRPVTEDLLNFKREASDIVIGTPGRIEDVLTRYNVMDVSELEILVLDEADVLLFVGKTVLDPTIAMILSKLPKMRRTGIFSATTTFTSNKTNIKSLMQRAGMRNPVLINVQVATASTANKSTLPASSSTTTPGSLPNDEDSGTTNPSTELVPKESSTGRTNTYTPVSLTNYYLVTKLEEKISRLAAFLKSHCHEKMIVFFLTCACVDFYGSALQQIFKDEMTTKTKKHGKDDSSSDATFSHSAIHVELLHGKLVQKRREKAMERFRDAQQGGIALFCTDVAARGVDVDNVDWVIQVDAPQDPSQFVHRVGRAARAGRKGSSLVLLTDKEEAYVDLLANRHVRLIELPENEVCHRPIQQTRLEEKDSSRDVESKDEDATDATTLHSNIPNILITIRERVLKDRDLLEKGTKAFTSYIRAYKEHICCFIFRFAALDLGHLATSFCLLRLPKMPELQASQGKLKHFTPAGYEVNIFAIPYLDKAREAARQVRLAEELAAGGKNAKQIKAEQRKAEQLRKEQEWRQQAIEKGRNPDKKRKKRGKHQQIVDEWEDLAREERLFKKFRRGKITKADYEELLHGGSINNNTTTIPPKGGVTRTDDSESGMGEE